MRLRFVNAPTPEAALTRRERNEGKALAEMKRRRTRPDARTWFDRLRPFVLAARPVVGKDRRGGPVFGRSTFRNVIDERGRLS